MLPLFKTGSTSYLGLAVFRSLPHAIRYYARQNDDSETVRQSIEAGEISLGALPESTAPNFVSWDNDGRARETIRELGEDWSLIDCEEYNDALGALPPIEWNRGGFLLGEPADSVFAAPLSALRMIPRYHAFAVERCPHGSAPSDFYFRSKRPLTVAEWRAHCASRGIVPTQKQAGVVA